MNSDILLSASLALSTKTIKIKKITSKQKPFDQPWIAKPEVTELLEETWKIKLVQEFGKFWLFINSV